MQLQTVFLGSAKILAADSIVGCDESYFCE